MPHELILRVVEEDLDDRAHVNNVVCVRWVQDAAAAHWHLLASEVARAEVAWVALRHEIDYLSPAVMGDEIAVRTWVGVAEGLSFERFTEILRRSNKRLLAKARTLWCPVDARTGKPRRVSDEIRARCSVPRTQRSEGTLR